MISVQTEDFDPAREYQALRDSGSHTGAIVTFTGLVRDQGERDGVTGLYLEHYPGMTERVIRQLVDEARQRWNIGPVRIIHRVGELALSDQIVFVGVGSAHRGDAFAACEYLMDALKTTAPFWKKEITGEGAYWVEQKATDVERARAWQAATAPEAEKRP